MDSDLQDIEQIRPSSNRSVFLERTSSSIPPMSYVPGQRLSEVLSVFEADEPTLEDVSQNKVNGNGKTKLELSSLAMFGPGKAKPSHHSKLMAGETHKESHLNESNRQLEKILEGDLTSAVQGPVGLPVHEDTMISGIMLDERPASRMTDIDV